jgi:cell wall-associated NlpC family hydrolase
MKNHRRKRFRYRTNFKLFKKFLWQKRRLLLIGAASAVIIIVAVCVISYNSVTTAAAMTTAATASAVGTASPEATPTPEPTPTPTPTPTPDPTLKKGDQNDQVQKLQERLMELGYMAADESTKLYGPVTEYAVELFQRQYAREQNGIADPDTLNLIYAQDAKHYTLLQGTSGDDVDSLQRQLIDLGFMDKASGYYGTETIEAVKAFQKRNNLTIDGKTGQETLDLLYSPNALQSSSKAVKEKKRATIQGVIATAEKQLGDPYVWGAQGPNSFDCSGLVYYCLKQAGSSRTRYDAAGYSQVSDWQKITSMDKLEKGDLLFFSTNGKKVGHTGIYVGEGMMIDASSANGKVVKRACKTSFWEDNFVVARRPW